MNSADLGQPILLFILISWAVFAVFAILAAFMRRGAKKDVKEFFKRLTDTSHIKHSH